MATDERQLEKNTVIQTLIFSKEKFKTAQAAKAWAREHDFRADKVDETDESFRLRQREPSEFKEGSFRTISITDGVKAVIGKLKEARMSSTVMGMIEDQKITRMARIDEPDPDSRTVDVSVVSETDKIKFGPYSQILLHERSAVDLTQLREIGAVLFNHDPDRIVGRPTNIRLDLEERRLRASIVFDEDPESEAILSKVRSGSLRGVSVGFRVESWQRLEEGDKWESPEKREFKGPAYIATKWRPVEFSLTPIPADASVGVGRSETASQQKETPAMAMPAEARAALEKSGLPKDATDEEAYAFLVKFHEGERKDGAQPEPKKDPEPKARSEKEILEEGRRQEEIRRNGIEAICNGFPETRELAAQLIQAGASIDDARSATLKRLAEVRKPIGNVSRIELGEEAPAKFARAAENWLISRTSWGSAALTKEQAAEARDIPCATLMEFAREWCRRNNQRPANWGAHAVTEHVFTRAMSHTTSDFASILANVANKALLRAYDESPATWRPFCSIVSVPDFKNRSVTRLGDNGDLILTPDGAPMPEGSIPDTGETYAIATYSRRFGITRQTIINDDLSAFDRIPTLMGKAARRVPHKLFYDLLTSASGVGPTMTEDAKALFATDHPSGANYTTGAFAIDIANLGTAKALMRKQAGYVATGETAPILNLTPAYILAPAALETVALQVVTQITPATIATAQPLWVKQLEVVIEPYLDGKTNGTTAWYLAANPGTIVCCEMAFLDGREQPTMIREVGTNILGLELGIYLDAGVKFVDHRGWYRAKGA